MDRAQGFKSKVHVEGQLYRIGLDGVVDALATNFQRPNGLAFSEDEKRLYITDTGFLKGYAGHITLSSYALQPLKQDDEDDVLCVDYLVKWT